MNFLNVNFYCNIKKYLPTIQFFGGTQAFKILNTC